MQPQIYGYTWNDTYPTAPRLIRAVSYTHASPRRIQGPIRHAAWVVDYSRCPGHVARVGSPASPWRPRAAWVAHLYPPQTLYWEDTRAVEEMRGAYFIFSGGEAAKLAELLPPGEPYASFHDPLHRVDNCLELAARSGRERGERGFWIAQAALCQLIDLLHESCLIDYPPADRLIQDRQPAITLVERVEAFFREHLPANLRLADVAQALNLKVSTLCHQYRADAGQPPMARLIQLRVELAKHLLQQGFKLHEIAERTGFCDAYHLSKTFRRVTGISPRQFRAGEK